MTLKWCSRWCSEEWSTTCAGRGRRRGRSPRPLGSTNKKPGTRRDPSEADGGTRSRMTVTGST